MFARELYDALSEITGFSQRDIKTVFQAFSKYTVETLMKDADAVIPIPYMGKISTKMVGAGYGIVNRGNLIGKKFKYPVHLLIQIKAAPRFRDSLYPSKAVPITERVFEFEDKKSKSAESADPANSANADDGDEEEE